MAVNVGLMPMRRNEMMNKTVVPSRVFFLPILSARKPPKNGVAIPATARLEPIQVTSSIEGIVGRGFSGPDDVSTGIIEDDQPIARAATKLERLADKRKE